MNFAHATYLRPRVTHNYVFHNTQEFFPSLHSHTGHYIGGAVHILEIQNFLKILFK